MSDLTGGRHEDTLKYLGRFNYLHLRPELQAYSKPFHDLAHRMVEMASDGPDLTVALRHLLSVKDEFVRIGVDEVAVRAPLGIPVQTAPGGLTGPAASGGCCKGSESNA